VDWNEPIDAYCERLSAGLWAEPLNALTNAAFVIAAFVMARRLRRARLHTANLLVAILLAIGVGSFLFHTFASVWAGLADTLPIVLFVLIYLHAANRGFLGLDPVKSLLATLAALAAGVLGAMRLGRIEWFASSSGYAPIPILILAYAWLMRRRTPETARGLALGGGLLILSITLRTLDEPFCATFPIGTHFLWHLLNALMLGWMIEVYRRHMLAGRAVRR
jgi:hypothetical protein